MFAAIDSLVLASLVLAAAPAAVAAPAHSAAEAPESRPPSEAERRALLALLKREHGADAASLAEPQFRITRAPSARRWHVRASLAGRPKAGWKQVCHQRRAEYEFGPRGWHRLPQPSVWVWLGAPRCAVPAAPVQLRAPLPDTEILPLLERQRALGERMRVLMVGNSECASQRGLGFALRALDVSNPAGGAELMPMLTYGSSTGTEARLYVRRNGANFDPWTVSCPREEEGLGSQAGAVRAGPAGFATEPAPHGALATHKVFAQGAASAGARPGRS